MSVQYIQPIVSPQALYLRNNCIVYEVLLTSIEDLTLTNAALLAILSGQCKNKYLPPPNHQ